MRMEMRVTVACLSGVLLIVAPAFAQTWDTSNPPWAYATATDEITGQPVPLAKVESTNTVQFGFPYQGEQKATLMLREHPRFGFDIMLYVQRGQFLCRSEHCGVLVRFDQQNPIQWPASPPTDGSTNIIFFKGKLKTPPQQIINLGGPALLDELRKASELRIAAQFYQEGERTFLFDVAGLKWTEPTHPLPPPKPQPSPEENPRH